MPKTYKFTFPFRGKVKTQMKLFKKRDGSVGMRKPADVVQFENKVRAILAKAFPEEFRPIEGYIKLELLHYTTYRRDKNLLLVPTHSASDLDNIIKIIGDLIQPVYVNSTLTDDEGNPLKTKTGKLKSFKKKIIEGVIIDDKYIADVSAKWVPIEDEHTERIEVFIATIPEEELFGVKLDYDEIIDLGEI